AVEGAVALVQLVLDPAPLERRLERGFGEVPLLVRAELVLGARRQLGVRAHPEQVVDELRVVEAAEDLLLDLLTRAEDVRVVLRDVPDAGEAVERARELVPVERRRLGVAKRELAVAAS